MLKCRFPREVRRSLDGDAHACWNLLSEMTPVMEAGLGRELAELCCSCKNEMMRPLVAENQLQW